MKRFMIAGTRSGSGKTTVTCAVLRALVNRGYEVASFKCGPDYIDPMFHSRIIGTDSHNLDRFFCTRETVSYLMQKYFREVNVIEGVMGFYDGVKGAASSHQVAVETDTPVVLVIDCKGMSDSIGAIMQGFLSYRQPNTIIGFIFNRLPESLVELAQSLCRKMKVTYFGRLPDSAECTIESRHLGLVTAAEIAGLEEKTNRLAVLAEQNILLDRLLALTESNPVINPIPQIIADCSPEKVRIAVADDNAFCFYYKENLDLLRELGCELVSFSPLRDQSLPRGISGLLIGGGYPELYSGQLSRNVRLLREMKERIIDGLPTVAECGGFMFLHEQMQGDDGNYYQMAGVISGRAFRTGRLQRFGYITLTAGCDSLLCGKGQRMAAHEFHYWDSTDAGNGLTASKSDGRTWECCHVSDTMYAGFPHLYFPSDIRIAERFAAACAKFGGKDEPDPAD